MSKLSVYRERVLWSVQKIPLMKMMHTIHINFNFFFFILLAGVSEDVSFSPEMVKKFEAMVMGRQLYAVGKGKDSITGRLMVLLIDTSAEHDVVINKELSA